MSFDPLDLSSFLLILTAWGGAFIAALWLSLVIWTYRDIRTRGKDPLVRILAVLVVGVLFLPGIVIYLILRPARTLEEEYQHTLEEEALLQAIEERHVCPGCARHAKDDWRICPYCHTKLKKACHHCGYPMELPWNICPHCGTPAPGMRKEKLTLDEALQPLTSNYASTPMPVDLAEQSFGTDFSEELTRTEFSDESLETDYSEDVLPTDYSEPPPEI